jgi:hypothetical protein
MLVVVVIFMFYLIIFVVCLTTLSVDQMMGFAYNELERMWKEVVLTFTWMS